MELFDYTVDITYTFDDTVNSLDTPIQLKLNNTWCDESIVSKNFAVNEIFIFLDEPEQEFTIAMPFSYPYYEDLIFTPTDVD